MLVDSLGSGLFLPFSMIFFLRTTALTLPAIGAALSLAELINMPGLLVYGQLLDRMGPRAVVGIGNLVSAVGFVGFLAVHSAPMLVLCATLVDCGSGLFWTASPALINLAADPGERSRWFGLSRVLRNAGVGVGALAAAALVSATGDLGLRILVVANSASFLGASALVGWWWRGPLSPPVPVLKRRPNPQKSGYLEVLRDRHFMRLMAANLVFVLCGDSLILLLSVYVNRDLRSPLAIAGMLFTVNTALVVLLQTSLTRLAERTAKPRVLRWSAALWGASFIVLGALAVVPKELIIPGLLVAITIFTGAEMLESPAMSDLVVTRAEGPALGRYLGVNQVSWAVAGAASPILFTWLLNRGPMWPWLVLSGACLGAILVLEAGGPDPGRLRRQRTDEGAR